jgi:ABC-2 type transport system ATP-binding protein
MPIIEAAGLTKRFRQPLREPGLLGAFKHLVTQQYRDKVAVDGIDLAVEAGESVAYLGPNGAGKSTTIKMLTGILVPTSGQVAVDGRVPHATRHVTAHTIGVVFGHRTQLWWDIPVIESFNLLRDVYAIPEAQYRATLAQFTELLDLGEFLHLSVRKISLGQRMRADLAAALLHRPRILFLDEPTIGLDIAVKTRIRQFIRTLNREHGTTVLLTTHDLGDIEDLCRRLVIIDQGRIIYDGSLAAVKDAFARERTMHVQLRAPAPGLVMLDEQIPGISLTWTSELELAIRFDRFQVPTGELVSTVVREGEIADLRFDEPAIEDVIRRVYDGTLTLAPTAHAPVAAEGTS